MLIDQFFRQVAALTEKVRMTQVSAIEASARLIVDALEARRRTFVFGSGHSNVLTQEVVLRAGELAIFNPLFVAGLMPTDYPYIRSAFMERISGVAAAVLETTPVEGGDIIVIISTSGRNHVPIEMALEAKKRGLRVIALTSVEFSSQFEPRHPSGKKLFEIADVVIDSCCPPGDGSVEVPGIPAKIGPVSTILGAVILHAISCRICDLLLERGLTPPIFRSGNVDGASEYDKQIRKYYEEHLVHA